DIDVALFVVAADVVGFTGHAGFDHAQQGAGVVFDIEPVADLQALAVDGQGFAFQGVEDDQRNQFFREMAGAVVVGAIGHQHRQAVGTMPGPHQVVRSRLAGGIGRTGRVGRGFREEVLGSGQVAVDLVGGDVVEAEGGARGGAQPVPVGAGGFQQRVGADHIGLYEGGGAVDGAVDVGFRRQVHDGV